MWHLWYRIDICVSVGLQQAADRQAVISPWTTAKQSLKDDSPNMVIIHTLCCLKVEIPWNLYIYSFGALLNNIAA